MMQANSKKFSCLQYVAILRGQGHTKVNIKFVQDFDVENIPVKLWHDACNS